LLADLLHANALAAPVAALLVGRDTGDDAAVYRLSDEVAIVATTDFFMPIVDDPFDFGRIAAANALSDVYAMGGTPLFALAVVGMPIKVLPVTVIREILRGGESVCAEAGIPVAGGHSIDSAEPIYGLVAIGQVAPADVRRNSDGRPGDALVLGKPLGVGILSAAFKRDRLDAAGYRRLIDTTTRLNRAGPGIARIEGLHAMTDVTGFGLLGHLLGVCRGSGVRAIVERRRLPVLPGVLDLAADGVVTGASARNWASHGERVQVDEGCDTSWRDLLTDPQTSGGLLVSCAPAAVETVLAEFERHGCEDAAVIGQLLPGEPGIRVT
jgi:selenide,water dikinase